MRNPLFVWAPMVVIALALWFSNPPLVLKPGALVGGAVISGCIGFVMVPPESRSTPLGLIAAVVVGLIGLVDEWWVVRAVERSARSRGAVAKERNEGKATASLVIGLVSIFSMGVPLIFVPAAIPGIVMGIKASHVPATRFCTRGYCAFNDRSCSWCADQCMDHVSRLHGPETYS